MSKTTLISKRHDLTIVLPLLLGQGSQIFFEVALMAYAKYLEVRISDFIIITPRSQILQVRQEIGKRECALPVRVVAEEDLFQRLGGGIPQRGWVKQQLLKLLAAHIVDTPTYLVVDGDMFPCQPINYDDLFDAQHRTRYHTENYAVPQSQNHKWWAGSCALLGIALPEKGQMEFMGVSPQLLWRSCVHALLTRLTTRHGDKWPMQFEELGATEYTLYWLSALLDGDAGKLHTPHGYPLWKHDEDRNILTFDDEDEVNAARIKRAFVDPRTLFAVAQGYLPYNIVPVIAEARKFLARPSISAVMLCASMLKPKRYGFFSAEQRLQHTVDTALSVKRHFPDALLLLIEGSELTSEEREVLLKHYACIMEVHSDPAVQAFIHHPTNIGMGECKLLELGTRFMQESILPMVAPRRLFKMGTRYQLTEEFQASAWNPRQFGFREHYDSDMVSYVFTTGLFSIPLRELGRFLELFARFFRLTDRHVPVEQMYRFLLPQQLVQHIEPLGLEGRLSYNGTLFRR